jgi:hypothetical protein
MDFYISKHTDQDVVDETKQHIARIIESAQSSEETFCLTFHVAKREKSPFHFQPGEIHEPVD